jgi:hypothetical protein
VLVLSARPGRAEGVVRIDLPYPRDIGILSSDQLGRYVREVRALMDTGEKRGAREAAPLVAAL